MQPQFCLHKWRLAPVLCHGGFDRPLLERAFWMPNLSTLEGQTSKCRYIVEENNVLLQRRKHSQVFARYTLWVYHFKTFKSRLYVNTVLAARWSDE